MKIFLILFFIFITKVQNEQNLQQGANLYCSIFFINSQLQNFFAKIEKQNPALYKLIQHQQKNQENQDSRVLEETNAKQEVTEEQKQKEKIKREKLKEISQGTLAQGIVQNRPDDYSVIDKESGQLMKKNQESNSLKDLQESRAKTSLTQSNGRDDAEILKNKELEDKETQKFLLERKNINQSRDFTIEIECKTIGDFYEQQTMMRIDCKKTDYFTIKYPDKDKESFKIQDYLETDQYKSRMIQINYESAGSKDTLGINQRKDACMLYISSQNILNFVLVTFFLGFVQIQIIYQ